MPDSTDGLAWPKLTVITPSFMQGEFLEQTIRSVLLQGYPNIEYFILDGGSTDSSRAIIEKYAPWLAGWRCEKDAGQAAAVNEGWTRATGEVFSWINSDDWYQPGALAAIATHFRGASPADWVAGPLDDCAPDGTPLKRHPAWPTPLPAALGFHEFGYYQPGMFWSRRLVEKVGLLDVNMHLCFDLEFWARSLAAGFSLTAVDAPIACFRQHGASKSFTQLETIIDESREVFRRCSDALSAEDRRQSAQWWREYAADLVLDIVYRRLQQGRRRAALSYLLREWRTAMALRPRSLLIGALVRVLTTGRPPAWFQ
ncbi:MAG: glycosyltransferase family 2 protein [Chthoniobacter sp.]|nr:glycosyltransferase family 2 protein [Chthoniobacter sp.]